MVPIISLCLSGYVAGLLIYFLFFVYGPQPWRRNRIGRSVIILTSSLELTFIYLLLSRILPWSREVRMWVGLGVFVVIAVALTYKVLSFRREIKERKKELSQTN